MPETANLERSVRSIIVRVFDLSPNRLNDEFGIGNPPQWDSIGHMQLLVAIENEFGLRFQMHEIVGLVTVQAIVQALSKNHAS
jgi:acyl carrier protein